MSDETMSAKEAGELVGPWHPVREKILAEAEPYLSETIHTIPSVQGEE